MLEKAEIAAKANDMKTVYEITRKLSRRKQNQSTQIRDKEGNLLKTEIDIQNRWKEYFTEIYTQQENPTEIGSRNQNYQELDISTDQIRKDEVNRAINKLKNGKAAGKDNIPADLITAGGEAVAELIFCLLTKIWNKEEVPDEWTEGIIIKIPKKGDSTRCENWRPITLLNTTSKILTHIIMDRIKEPIDTSLRNNQAGFRPRRGCTDQICTLRIIIDEALEWQKEIYLGFIDFEKAFDKINRVRLWEIIKEYGIPPKIIRIIKLLYNNYGAYIENNGSITEKIKIDSGVRQGCVLSPLLFLIATDWIMKRTCTNKQGLLWNFRQYLEDLEFADDVCLITEKLTHMQSKIHDLKINAEEIGLKINLNKSNIMPINPKNAGKVEIAGKEIKKSNEIVYLGSVLENETNCMKDINRRIMRAQITFNQLRETWYTKELSVASKIRIFNSNVKSTLLYGCESWAVNKKQINSLQSFVNRCLRKILRIYWPNTISNNDLWERTNQTPIIKEIKRRKWRWLGHTLRKPNNDITKQATEFTIKGSRKQGRPAMTWKRQIAQECNESNLKWGEVKRIAKNKDQWKSLVSDICEKTT